MMDNTVEALCIAARAVLDSERRLDKMHTAYFGLLQSGRMTRARTTTYNARAGTEAEHLCFAKATLRDACRAYLGLAKVEPPT